MSHSEFLLRLSDASTEQFSYQRADGKKILDLTHFKDRENRWTLFAKMRCGSARRASILWGG